MTCTDWASTIHSFVDPLFWLLAFVIGMLPMIIPIWLAFRSGR